MSFNLFDKILYINLDHRKDRKKDLLKTLKRFKVKKEKIKRIPAHYYPFNGHTGCSLSHIDALNYAIEKKFKNILILEDDCEFINHDELINHFIKYFHQNVKNWDVFLLGGKVLKSEESKYEHIQRVTKSMCSHAYGINNHYFQTLKENYLFSFNKLKNILLFSEANKYTLDKTWQKLQKKNSWYMPEIVLAGQKKSYSDISKQVIEVTHKKN